MGGLKGGNELPKELPKDFQDKFEIKDTSEASPEPSPGPSPSPAPGASPAPTSAAQPVTAAQPGKKSPRRKRGSSKKSAATGVSAPSGDSLPAFSWPVRRPAQDPLWVGEKLVYDITYFGMVAGEFVMEILPHKLINNRKVYHARGSAESSSVFSLFYRLNDTLETFVDYDGIFSHRFHILLDESKQTRDSLELYDSEKAQTYYWNRWNHKTKGYIETKDFFPIKPFPQDSFSALLYMRMQPLRTGDVFTFPVVSEGKTWDAVVTVEKREEIDTPMGRMKAIRLKPETKYQGILQKRGDSYMWLSDDDRHFLLRLEAKVKIGTVVGVLKKIESRGERPEAEK